GDKRRGPAGTVCKWEQTVRETVWGNWAARTRMANGRTGRIVPRRHWTFGTKYGRETGRFGGNHHKRHWDIGKK
ncbi:hypothetical protein KI387_019372, partial [Taxus chinensis]